MISVCESANVVSVWMDYLWCTNYMLYKANNKEMIHAHSDIMDPETRTDP